MKLALWTLLLLAGCRAPTSVSVQQDRKPRSLARLTAGMKRHDGFFPFYWDARQGKIWLEIARLGEEFLYVPWLATGLGSNPVGLDRGQLGGEKLVHFERVGPRVLLVQRNLRYRARTQSADERRAVEESFANSILWGGEIAAAEGDRLLVDFTDFLLRDARDVAGALQRAGEGTFTLDKKRSAIFLPRTKAFPKNTELEVTLTFAAGRPGRRVRETTPTPSALTLRQRHSLVALPEPGYEPRAFDPRAGSFSIVFADYATPLDAPLEKRWITRHRLDKVNPGAAVSPAVQPIVYYVDRGVPEPVRTALVEGARWWNEAFEAAGFENAFRVELLPPGADPLDIRYSVIQWVHRSTRGWSYGRSVTDPRTGQILKGHVSLGSLRVRQDRLIFEGVTGGAGCQAGHGPDATCFVPFDRAADPVEVALARIRQLSAHEVGHTLGFAHNFAASTYGRASVMDYPAPLVRLREDGSVDLSRAYAVGIGEWDKIAVRHAYSVWPTREAERAGLAAILDEARDRGMIFLTDQDARAPGSAHARASLWDNGADAVAELDRVMELRRATLARYGRDHLAEGRPLSELEEALVPLYLQHRYQVAACAKLLGGAFYEYALAGDGREGPRPVPPARQQEALEALLRTLDPRELVLPERLLVLIAPPAYGGNSKAETFPGATGALFDPLAAVAVAADLTVSRILHPARAARVEQFHARDPRYPGFQFVLAALTRATWYAESGAPATERPAMHLAARRVIDRVVLDRLIELAENPRAADLRGIVERELEKRAREGHWAHHGGKAEGEARRDALSTRAKRFLERPHRPAGEPARPVEPPGSPIGR